MKTLKDKIILVTGGGQGLGEQIVRTLADEDAIVIVGDIKDTQVKVIADEIVKQGKRAEGVHLNVMDEQNCKEVIKEIVDRHGRIDVLINNAGIDVTKSILEITPDEIQRVIDVNLCGPFLLSKAVFPVMAKNKFGHIVNIVSTAAKRAWKNATAYHASKWGLLGLSHALHTEGRDHNITVTAIVAGGMRTPFILERFPDTPLDVLQDPKNVANAVRFALLQPEGTVIPEMMVLPAKETSWP